MQRFVCLLACLSIVLSSASAADIYVKADATGANNGSSWTDAYTSLSSAITASTTGDAIRVATGTYRPQYVSGFPSLKSGVSLTGGYYVTGGVGYLWGDYSDIDGDIGTQGVHTDDAGKLFELWQISNVSISGFAFRYTRGSNYGGMIHVLSGSNITISDCIFRDANMSDSCRGGAVSIYGSTGTTVSNCEFYDCHAGLGGAMNLDGNPSSPVTYTITGCSLHDNDTTSASTFETSRAGAVFLYSSNAAFTNCTFENNLSGNGGAVNISLGNASFSGCAFRYNQAGDSSTSSAGNRGGAVCVGSTVSSSSSVPEVSFADCDFKGNVAYGRGGAVFGTLKTTIERCWFRGNQSLFNATSSNVETLGGAVFIATEAIGNNVDSNTTSVTSNSVFVSNSAGKGEVLGRLTCICPALLPRQKSLTAHLLPILLPTVTALPCTGAIQLSTTRLCGGIRPRHRPWFLSIPTRQRGRYPILMLKEGSKGAVTSIRCSTAGHRTRIAATHSWAVRLQQSTREAMPLSLVVMTSQAAVVF